MTTPLWLERHLTMPCTIYNRIEAGVDEYGNVMYAEVATDTECFFQPVAMEQIQDGRAQVGQYLMHFRAAMAGLFDGFARVEVGGVSYEIVAPPAVYPAMNQVTHHVEITVQRGSADEE